MLKVTKTITVEEKAKALVNDAKKLTTLMLAKSGMDSFGDLDDEDTLMIRDCYKLMDDCYDLCELYAKQMDQMNERLEDIINYLKEMDK